MNKYEIFKFFQLFGRDLFLSGINNSHSGNMSFLSKDFNNSQLFITRTGSMLGNLSINDIIETTLYPNEHYDKFASRELIVHRSIYLSNDSYNAIIHAHPKSAIALSLVTDIIKPIDEEGKYYFPNGIKVVSPINAIASKEVAELVIPILKSEKIVMIKGHGSFACGKTLEECFLYTTVLDSICNIILNYNILTLKK